jgi:hypothetical protein
VVTRNPSYYSSNCRGQVVGMLIGMVTMRLARAYKAAAVIRRNSVVLARSEKADPKRQRRKGLRELVHLLEPYEAPLSTRVGRVN